MSVAAQYSSVNIPPWLEAMAKYIAEQSQKIGAENYHIYTGQRIAPFSKEQQEAQRLSAQTGHHQPYFNEARGLLGRSAESFPAAYNRYQKPYEDAVVNRIGELGGRTFREQILPALTSKFSLLGHAGSSQHKRMIEHAARDSQENVLAQQINALYQGYGESARIHEADRLRAMQAAEQFRDLGRYNQAGHLADIAALEHSGQQQQGLQQQNLDLSHQNFLQQRIFPRAQLAEHAATVQGLPYSQLTYGQNSFPNQYRYPESGPFAGGRPNTLGNIGSLAGQLYGISRMGRKEGGPVKKQQLGHTSLNTSSFVRQPKVGGKTVIPRRII